MDDPTITQPLLYKKIEAHPPLWQAYAQRIGLSEEEAERRAAAMRAELDAAQEEAKFQQRWAEILQVPADTHRVQLDSDELVDRVAELFPRRPLPWATAIHHSPDFMLAAEDAAAVARDEHLFVLGELHLSFNTMESRLFVQQHDDPASMLAAAEADLGDRRIYSIPSREVPGVSSRVSPPSALMSPNYTYWTIHLEAAAPPGPIIPAADLTVQLEDDRLIVRSGSGELTAPLSRVFGELLSAATVNAFKPIARDGRSPRITIDQLVLARESWSFPAEQVAWARDQVRGRPVLRGPALAGRARAAGAGLLQGAGGGQADLRRLPQPGVRQHPGQVDPPLGRGAGLGQPDRDAARPARAVAGRRGRRPVHLGVPDPHRGPGGRARLSLSPAAVS